MENLRKDIFTWALETRDSGAYNMMTEIWRPLKEAFVGEDFADVKKFYIEWMENPFEYEPDKKHT